MIINADSAEQDDVNDAVQSAAEGDTVVIPAETAHWTGSISWNAPPNVILKGGGTAATGGGDQTVIIDDSNLTTPLLQIIAFGPHRMTGITVQSGIGTGIKNNGTLAIHGAAGGLRIDHCHFASWANANAIMIEFGSGVFGVMDHCILDWQGLNALYFKNGRQSVGHTTANLEWSLPTAPGGANYFFIEDNIINGVASRIYDGWNGAKVVTRFNNVHRCVLGEVHGTGHAGDDRGVRAQESYGNLVTTDMGEEPNFCGLDLGSGCSLLWGNSWDQAYKSFVVLKLARRFSMANGGPYNQVATPDGWGYAGTENNGTGSNWDGGTVNATDLVEGYPCIDMPGRGQGDLLTGVFPTKINDATGTLHWPNQALEPIYIWANVGAIRPGYGDNEVGNQTGGRAAPNRDFYLPASGVQVNATTPFDGTEGVGWGPLALRPTTCTPGVAYFATDQGSWNTSETNPYGVQQNGASGVLYVCNAPDSWTLYYTPYIYPHPLRGEFLGPPTAPEFLEEASITGGDTVGETLTADPGDAYGNPDTEESGQWFRCTTP